MENFIDIEGRVLESGIFSHMQIDDMKLFFSYILRKDQSCLDFDDFAKFIKDLVGATGLINHQQMKNFFKVFDHNGDQQLDWSEYLQSFLNACSQNNFLKSLKILPTIQHKRRFFFPLLKSIEYLISPFNLPNQLNYVQQELLQYEFQIPSFKHLKSCYYLQSEDIIATPSIFVPPNINIQNIIQQFYSDKKVNIIEELIIFFKTLLQQRAPHQISIIGNQYKTIILQLYNFNLVNELNSLLFHNDTSNYQIILPTLKLLTILINSNYIFSYDQDQFNKTLPLLIQFIISEDLTIKYQSLICLGHLIILNPKLIDIIFEKNYSAALMQIPNLFLDRSLLLYHSWILSCLSGRYQDGQIEEFIIRMNMINYQNQTKVWVMDLIKYAEQIIQLIPINNPIAVEIHINMIYAVTPLLVTPNQHQFLWDFISELYDPKLNLVILSTIKKIFKCPIKLNFQNLPIIIHLYQNNLLQNLLRLSTNPLYREKALKLLIGTICIRNYNLTLNFLEDTGSQLQFLSSIMGIYQQITKESFPESHHYFKQLILRMMIVLATNDFLIFQQLALKQFMIFELRSYIEYHHRTTEIPLALIQREKIYELQADNAIWVLMQQFTELYSKHFQFVFFGQANATDQTFAFLEQILIDEKTLDLIHEEYKALMSNMKRQVPLLVKRYLKSIYSNILGSIFSIGSFISQCYDLILQYNVQGKLEIRIKKLLDETLKVHEQIKKRSKDIEENLFLVGSLTNQEGTILSVYQNEYKSKMSFKMILSKTTSLLELEKKIEKELQTNNPMIYIIMNQNSEPKTPYDQTIINEYVFEKFSKQIQIFIIHKGQMALQLIETQNGSRVMPQEIIAVDLFKLKFEENYTMRKIFQIMNSGTKYFELKNIQTNPILWNLESQTMKFSDKQGVIYSLYQETQLEPEHFENIYDMMISFLQGRSRTVQSFLIIVDDFIDYLNDFGVPFSVGQNLTTFLQKGGNVDFRDFSCLIASFIQKQFGLYQIIFSSNDVIILKLVYLVYVDQQTGQFGMKELKNYLKDMIAIQQNNVSEDQLQIWVKELLGESDLNNDGFISFFEFHSLLSQQQYKTRLLDPLVSTLCTLTRLRQNYFFNSSRKPGYTTQYTKNFDQFSPALKRQYANKVSQVLFP